MCVCIGYDGYIPYIYTHTHTFNMHLNVEWIKEKKYMIHIQLINREANHLCARYTRVRNLSVHQLPHLQ